VPEFIAVMPFIRHSLISLCGSSTMRQRCSPRRRRFLLQLHGLHRRCPGTAKFLRSDRGCDTRIRSTAVWHPFRRQTEPTEHHTNCEGHTVNLSFAQHNRRVSRP
jgi:hypothetical protein